MKKYLFPSNPVYSVSAFNARSRRGTMLGASLMVSTIIIAFLAAYFTVQTANARLTNVQVWRDRLHQGAYEGFARSLNRITADPTLSTFGTVAGNTAYAEFSCSAELVKNMTGDIKTLPELQDSIYLVVVATLTSNTAPAPRSVRAHAFISASNAGKYFGASKKTWRVSQLFNEPEAELYGRDLVIESSGAVANPAMKKAHFFKTATTLDKYEPYPYAPISMTPTSPPSSRFRTVDSPNVNMGIVNQAAVEPMFPPLSPSNMASFKAMATGGVNNSFFPGDATFPDDIVAKGWAAGDDIYPPGCTTSDCLGISNNELANHVYYVEGRLNIRGKVHGQILFVATGGITINGDLISDSLTASADYEWPVVGYPGVPLGSPSKADKKLNVGFENASNAHQAVLITPHLDGIKIDNTAAADAGANIYVADYPDTFTIEAFIFSPYSGHAVVDPSPAAPQRKYSFLGALILGAEANFRGKINPQGPNPTRYMTSLATRPPPNIPAFSQLQVWYEEFY